MKIGIISGYFNPLHGGHLEYMKAVKMQSEYLIAIINNDLQVYLKRSKKFMDENHRCNIISALRDINLVQLSIDTDYTVCKSIELIRKRFPQEEMLFFNSGDRTKDNIELSEVKLCKQLKIKYVVINLPKRYSSSNLLKQI